MPRHNGESKQRIYYVALEQYVAGKSVPNHQMDAATYQRSEELVRKKTWAGVRSRVNCGSWTKIKHGRLWSIFLVVESVHSLSRTRAVWV